MPRAARSCCAASTTTVRAGCCRWTRSRRLIFAPAPPSCRHCASPGGTCAEDRTPLNPRELIMVGVSGGVDSSVAALLLQRDGANVAGLFMKNWEEDERLGPCRADADRRDAVAVCARLGLPFHARNFSDRYWDSVFEHFLAE